MELNFKYSEGQYVYNSNFNVDKDHKNKVIHYNEGNKEQKNAEILGMLHRLINEGINHKVVVDPSNKFCLIMWEA